MRTRQRKDTGAWLVDYRHNGTRVQETIPNCTSKEEAEAVAATIKADILRETYGFGKKSMRFSLFVADVFLPYSKTNKKSHTVDKSVCRHLGVYFKGKTLKQITVTEIEKYKQWFLAKPIIYGPEGDRKEKERKPATVNNHLRILSKILSMAVNAGELDSNPCRKVDKLQANNQRTRVLSPAEERKLLMALAPDVKPVIIFALHTGMRRGELFNLKWDDVDFDTRSALVRQSKSGKRRHVPLNKTVIDLLRGMDMGTDYVFPSPHTGEKRVEIKTTFNTAKRNAGIADFRFHDLRHTAATRMGNAGVSPYDLCEIFGWSDIRMAMRYCHANRDSLRRAVDAIG